MLVINGFGKWFQTNYRKISQLVLFIYFNVRFIYLFIDLVFKLLWD
jgi:hypothetical protein